MDSPPEGLSEAGDAAGASGATDPLDALVTRAREGERRALEMLIRTVQDDVYGLALRMLWHPEDAEDATQEILLRAITRLDTFRGESSFRTWLFRVASNHLLTTRRRRAEREELTFARFGKDLAVGLTDGLAWEEADAERRLLIEEVKIGCSQGMLLCLDREHRLAYILGDVVGLDHNEGSEVMGVSQAAFRKRVSRARRRLTGFLKEHCGLIEPANPCRCHRRVERAREAGRIPPDGPMFATHPTRSGGGDALFRRGKQAVEELRDAAALLRTNPDYRNPTDFAEGIRDLLNRDAFEVLDP